MKTLYSFTDEHDKEVFATLIGKNEDGHFVLEVRGTSAIVVMPPEDVKEVLPYTVHIKFGNSSSTGVNYEVPKGSLNKADLVIDGSGAIGRVIDLDTKARDARSARGLRVIETRSLSGK
jgi:hypothetical protein